MNHPRIVLADDHALFLEALRRLLEPACKVVAMVTDGHALVETAVRLQPEVVVADIGMPRLNGLDAARQLLDRLPRTRLVFLTVNEDPEVAAEAVRRGVLGYLLKKSAAKELFTAIDRVRAGRHYITPLITEEPAQVFVSRAQHSHRTPSLSQRQREVLQLLAEGRSMKEAASLLGVTPRTIAFHKYTMMKQHGFRTGAELIQYAVHVGLVDTPGSGDPTCQI